MNAFTIISLIVLFFIALWFGWRYFDLRRHLDQYANLVRGQNDLHIDAKELQNLSSAVTSLITAFDIRHLTLDAERARLATVLDQITDGVLIADEQGLIQFANPAAGKLFQTSNPLNRSIAEVVRNHQLVEAWRENSFRRGNSP